MKKVFFALLAMALLSTTATYATGGKVVKKQHAKKTCPKGCVDSKDCHKTAVCPIFPGCVCI